MKPVALCLLAAMLLCCGCAQTQEDPFRVDTVVLIPVDPTDAPTEKPTDAPTEEPTMVPTAAPTEEPTVPKETTAPKTTTYKSTGSGGKTSSSGKNQSTTTQKPKETQPAALPTPVLPPAAAPDEPPYNPSTYVIGELEYALMQELNLHRLEAGAGELTINERLSGIAYVRAQEVSVSWSHARPDGSDYTTVLSAYGFACDNTTELMIYGSGDGDAAVFAAWWMHSASHREQICSADFSTAGIGVYRANGITYLVCLLAG